jgi:hypothetical protein
MKAIDQSKKVDQGSVYGDTDMILCRHPLCDEMFKIKGHKKYHSPECKDDHHRMEREAGKKALEQGTIHARNIETCLSLQKVAILLSDRKEYTTMEIQVKCIVCNVPANELRHPKNGFIVDCHKRGEYWYYSMTGGFENLLRIPMTEELIEWKSKQGLLPTY